MSKSTLLRSAMIVIGVSVSAVAYVGTGYALFGGAAYISPGNASNRAVSLVSDPSTPFSGVDFGVPADLTFEDLQHLSTDYNVTDDDCAGGSPRFQINVDTGSGTRNIFAYIGPEPNYTGCPPGWVNSTDLLETPHFVDTSQLPLGTFYDPYLLALTKYGSLPVTGIQLVVDGGWSFADGEQTIWVDNTRINNTTHTYEPSSTDDCKNGGWQNFTAAPGPFQNQGDCVSHFAKQGE